MAIEYKVVEAATAAVLNTNIATEVSAGYFVKGSVACSNMWDTVGSQEIKLFSVLMEKQTS